MPGKGRGPGGARRRGLSGRLKIGSSCGCDWGGAAIKEPVRMPSACPRWYRDARIKNGLGCRGPMQHRRDLGLAA